MGETLIFVILPSNIYVIDTLLMLFISFFPLNARAIFEQLDRLRFLSNESMVFFWVAVETSCIKKSKKSYFVMTFSIDK